MKTFYTAFIGSHLSFLGKSFRWFWYYCFSHLYYTCLLGFFWVAQTKNHLNSAGMKFCQLKVLKVLLMHLFVTLLINKTTGSDNRHFFFNTLENENKEEFLTYSTFCTLEQIEKNILRKRLSQDALSKVHLNKYGSYFKFILLLSGDINLNPGPTAPKRNDTMRTSPFPQL